MKKHLDRNPLPPLPNSCYIDKTDLFLGSTPLPPPPHTHPPTQASHWLFQFGHWKGAHHYLPMVFILIPCSVLPIMLLEPFPSVGAGRAGASSCQYMLGGKQKKSSDEVSLGDNKKPTGSGAIFSLLLSNKILETLNEMGVQYTQVRSCASRRPTFF